MDIKRVLTSVIGLPIVALIVIFGNAHILNLAIMAIAIICMNEYFNVIKKICNPIKWMGYASTIVIYLVSILALKDVMLLILFGIPVILLLLFLHIIITDMKITFKDVAYTFLGIAYITLFMMFLSLIVVSENGKIVLGYTLLTAWSTDIFAYLVGKHFGKHKFSKVSPKKTIEGCVAGAIGATIVGVAYIAIANRFWALDINISYVYITLITLILSLISQIGDFAASSIKRFADSKDYGNMLPGHGGMLDRIDSLIFIAPFVYMIISIV